MKSLPFLFKGRLTAYQISTATDIDIEMIESLFNDEQQIESLDEATYTKLSKLEQSLFPNELKNNETSA
ncbi:hypothetical protein ROU88_03500 [Macrococcus capreoli]|uniref:hypothetical protein n=1 Tax=Macrococcus capreoli TaxID=2982690 RepID=UPI0021D59D4C|nr:hypothetical protein [Macrococcus sp. TMW 2.2395]MCU7558285.1 hypothetical protein [Macrococcus sp. TMW 2.2395]